MIDDLPVVVALPAPLDAVVTAWVERDLGWQVVDPAGPLRPILALADAPCGGLPWIAVTEGPPDDGVVTAQLTAGAEDVVGWPEGRERIPVVATRVDLTRRIGPRGPRVSVAGVAGGVGTSTIALAVGGVLAWGGASVLVVGGGALLELTGSSGRAHSVGTHVAVAGAAGLSVSAGRGDAAGAGWAGDVVVVDDGTRVTSSTTVLVTRPDAGLRRAREHDLPVIVNGRSPLGPSDARRALERAPLVQLPWSVRVARAGLDGRVPSGLPGRWLDELGTGLRRLERWS
ncbi:MAG TPA: hypothetical protein VK923_14450 [Euzebyales bacterium]|nr:hypothetical protein [Euzebyales bacterium]